MLTKEMSADKQTCIVTFTIDHGAAKEAQCVSVVGDFNDWDPGADPMERGKGGRFARTVHMACGDICQFRYLIDGAIWENDAEADGYKPTPFGDSENSVIEVPMADGDD